MPPFRTSNQSQQRRSLRIAYLQEQKRLGASNSSSSSAMGAGRSKFLDTEAVFYTPPEFLATPNNDPGLTGCGYFDEQWKKCRTVRGYRAFLRRQIESVLANLDWMQAEVLQTLPGSRRGQMLDVPVSLGDCDRIVLRLREVMAQKAIKKGTASKEQCVSGRVSEEECWRDMIHYWRPKGGVYLAPWFVTMYNEMRFMRPAWFEKAGVSVPACCREVEWAYEQLILLQLQGQKRENVGRRLSRK
ncbi:hypothetical protein BJ508DRAFT_332071 [Ascobolus immersus RN42]|uniref:Uncharacterized protein n=1 Tax=Ascobolus immersus RN42 TaxID=1160509 RepID=A0A3N4HTX2_ASCIM|nr:hypothetical protein BJ508DRAFT_332071 [Ascobolus immersus RN42]